MPSTPDVVALTYFPGEVFYTIHLMQFSTSTKYADTYIVLISLKRSSDK